jgi:hypothetical protein
MVLETLVFSPFNHLTWLVAREDFIILSRCESCRSYCQECHGKITTDLEDSDFPFEAEACLNNI